MTKDNNKKKNKNLENTLMNTYQHYLMITYQYQREITMKMSRKDIYREKKGEIRSLFEKLLKSKYLLVVFKNLIIYI